MYCLINNFLIKTKNNQNKQKPFACFLWIKIIKNLRFLLVFWGKNNQKPTIFACFFEKN